MNDLCCKHADSIKWLKVEFREEQVFAVVEGKLSDDSSETDYGDPGVFRDVLKLFEFKYDGGSSDSGIIRIKGNKLFIAIPQYFYSRKVYGFDKKKFIETLKKIQGIESDYITSPSL